MNTQQRAQPKQPLSLDQKLQLAQQSRDQYAELANNPELTLPAALAARNLARSYGAATQLYQKAKDNQAAENDPDSQNDLMRALGISPLRQDLPTSTPNQNQNSSTKPETFGSKT